MIKLEIYWDVKILDFYLSMQGEAVKQVYRRRNVVLKKLNSSLKSQFLHLPSHR